MNGLIMSNEGMNELIENVGRYELYDEMEQNPRHYPKYLKAVRVTLVELGFDAHWVDGPFRDALEKRYLDY